MQLQNHWCSNETCWWFKIMYDKILETSLKLIESLPKISAYFEYDEIGILKFEKDSNNPTNISITIVNDSNLNIESKFLIFLQFVIMVRVKKIPHDK